MEEALSGLKGVGLVKEEWDRDRLHVKFDPQQITVEQLLEVIAKQGFESEVEVNPQTPATDD